MTQTGPGYVPERLGLFCGQESAVTNSALLPFKVDTGRGFTQEGPAFRSPFTAPKGHVLCEALERGGGCFLNSESTVR